MEDVGRGTGWSRTRIEKAAKTDEPRWWFPGLWSECRKRGEGGAAGGGSSVEITDSQKNRLLSHGQKLAKLFADVLQVDARLEAGIT